MKIVIEVSDNVTNGDMCIAILKPRKNQIRYEGDWIEIEMQREGINFSAYKDWWNAPYKKSSSIYWESVDRKER